MSSNSTCKADIINIKMNKNQFWLSREVMPLPLVLEIVSAEEKNEMK